jgi:hypothetical protein
LVKLNGTYWRQRMTSICALSHKVGEIEAWMQAIFFRQAVSLVKLVLTTKTTR